MATQTRYKTVNAKVELGTTRLRRYEVAQGDEGWMYYDRVADLVKRGQMAGSFFTESQFLEFGSKIPTETITLDRQYLKGAILRPYLRNAPHIVDGSVSTVDEAWVKANYAFAPTNWDYWDFTRSEDHLFIECTQKYQYAIGTSQASIDAGTAFPLVTRLAYSGAQLGDGVDAPYDPYGLPDFDPCVGMCPNGFFAAGLRRQALTDEANEFLTTNLSYSTAQFTNIVFGNARWALQVPLCGKPRLYENVNSFPAPPGWGYLYPSVWVYRPWTEGNLSAVDPKKAATDGVTYRIGAIGQAICVTESSWDDDFAYYMDPAKRDPVMPAGPVSIENWPGQCSLWLDLMQFPEDAVLYRYPFEVPSYHEDRQIFTPFGHPATPLPDVDGGQVGTITPGVLDGYPNYMHYSVQLDRGQYPSADWLLEHPDVDALLTYTTPFVEAVTAQQDPGLTDNGGPIYVEATNATLDGEMAMESGNSSSQSQSLTVDNRIVTNPPGEYDVPADSGWVPTADFAPGMQVRLSAGWIYETRDSEVLPQVWTEVDGVVSQGSFWIVDADRNAKEGRFQLTDMLGCLGLARWTLGDLCGRGWHVKNFVEWLLESQGIGPDWYDLEDLDPAGYINEDSDKATWKLGTPIGQIIAEALDRFGGAVLWYDGLTNKLKSGCRYCRTARTAATMAAHRDNAWSSSGCLAADAARWGGYATEDLLLVDMPNVATDPGSLWLALSTRVRTSPLTGGEYANEIIVRGQSADDTKAPIVGYWRNTRGLYRGEGDVADDYIGFAVPFVGEDSSLNTRADVNNRLVELVMSKSSWCRTVEVTTPFLPAIKPGHVMRIEGGKAMGAHDCFWRITKVRHGLKAHQTTLEGREILGCPDLDPQS